MLPGKTVLTQSDLGSRTFLASESDQNSHEFKKQIKKLQYKRIKREGGIHIKVTQEMNVLGQIINYFKVIVKWI